MKLTIVGGGSILTPLLIDGLRKFADEVPVDVVALLDIDRTSVDRIAAFSRRVVDEGGGRPIDILATTDRQSAIEGSDFILFTIRVGGLPARIQDERIPLMHGIVGDETTGPGGFSLALRTIPVLLDYAHDIERWAPRAWVIPFSNPEGILTEALHRHSKIRVIGLCTAPFGLKRGIARFLGMDPARIELEGIGLTHLGWVRRIRVDGQDILPEVIQRVLASGKEDELYPVKLMQLLGTVPGQWFYSLAGYQAPHWYYHRDRVLKRQREAGKTRGEELIGIQASILPELESGHLTVEGLYQRRGHQALDEPILSLISALHNNKDEVHIVDVPNGGAVPFFDPDAVLEMPARIDREGAHPIPVPDLAPEVRGLMQMLKAYEELTIQAAVEGSYASALRALLAHPLVMSYDIARPLLDELLRAHAEYLPQFRGISSGANNP
jgi:6-phospho-beta-glucosidase